MQAFYNFKSTTQILLIVFTLKIILGYIYKYVKELIKQSIG